MWSTERIITTIALFVVGAVLGAIIALYMLRKKMKNFQEQINSAYKDQIRSMLSASGKKPSEEQVNRIFISSMKKTKDQKEKESKGKKDKKKRKVISKKEKN